MDIRKPTTSDFKEIIRSFSSDGRTEDDEDDEAENLSPIEMSEKHDEETDEMYLIFYYGDENKNGTPAGAVAENGGDTSKKPNDKKEPACKAEADAAEDGGKEIAVGTADEDHDREGQQQTRTGSGCGTATRNTEPRQQQHEVTDEELLAKEIEEDITILDEQLRTTPDLEEIQLRINETEVDVGELISVQRRRWELEMENEELLKADGPSDREERAERVELAREIRELKKQVAELRNSISGRDNSREEVDNEENEEFCITVGIFVKLLVEDEEFRDYFFRLKKQVELANDMILDLMGAQFASVEIEKESDSWMERRLGRALMDKIEYREILKQFAASTCDLSVSISDYRFDETLDEFRSEGNEHFLVTVGRFVRWLLENEEFKDFYDSCKKDSDTNAEDLETESVEGEEYSRGGQQHSDLWLEHRLGKKLVQLAELEEILGGFKAQTGETEPTVETHKTEELAIKYREIEKEITEKLQSNPNIDTKEKYLMLRNRIRELKGPAAHLDSTDSVESVCGSEIETDEESGEDQVMDEELIACLNEELNSDKVKELWELVETKLKAIENDKARMLEGKTELDESAGRLLELRVNITERSSEGWSEEAMAEMKAVNAKLKQIDKERYKLTEEYMKIDAEKVNLEAVAEKIKKKEQIMLRLMEASKSITKAKSIVQSVQRRNSEEAAPKAGSADGEEKRAREAEENRTEPASVPRKKVSLKVSEFSKSVKDMQEALARATEMAATEPGPPDTGVQRPENAELILQLKELSAIVAKVQGLMERVTERKPNSDAVEKGRAEDRKESTDYRTPMFISIAAATALALVGILRAR